MRRKNAKATEPLPIVGEPVNQPTGYVVRFPNSETSVPLTLNEERDILLIDYDTGTVFKTFDLAFGAAVRSVQYQRKHHLRWNEMYGPYVITPFYLPAFL